MLRNYKFESNPFGGNLGRPLECPRDKIFYVVNVDGFKRHKEVIEQFANPLEKFHILLIKGSSGSGRSSLVNYISDKFSHFGSSLKVVKNIQDDDFKNAIHTWFSEFSFAARQNNIALPEGLTTRLKDLRASKPFVNEDLFVYKDLLLDLFAEITAKNRSLVAVFEDVVNHRIFSVSADIFRSSAQTGDSPMLLIFTTADPRVADEYLRLKAQNSYLISLDSLTGSDVIELIEQRWKQMQLDDPHPFDKDGIKNVFSIRGLPMRRVLNTLEFILNEKVGTLEDPNLTWPHDSLKVSERDIAISMLKFDYRDS